MKGRHLIGAYLLSLLSSFAQDATFLVELRRQAPLDSLLAACRQHKLPVTERARLTLRHLLAVHKASQSEVEELARKSESTVVMHFWIVNAVALHGRRDKITTLEGNPAVKRVYTPEDLIFKFHQPVGPALPASEKAAGAAEPGLVAIGARALWALGYTGRGRLVLSFDTGVWPQHPAIQRQFLGLYRPLAQAWKTYHGVQEPADKSGSHGTHTIGIMLGLDPTQHDTIGLAPNAYYMAMDPIVVNLADTLPFVELMAAQQWALNPDGDTATVHDIPDVICNSWGRPPEGFETSFCNGITPYVLQALELAGIASEYSAGNDGPDSATSTAPAYVALTPVNAFSVGAVDAHSPGFPIAYFSSRGPSPCQTSGTLKIKPDVVAPGVNIRSSVGMSGYATYSGTSMAGPHAAGALLLLKEAFPYLPGETLKEALYYTATDLGAPGEDNTYGRGLIRVDSAFHWLVAQGYNPVPPNIGPDLAIVHVTYPNTDLLCNSLIQPQFTIINMGSQPFNGDINVSVSLTESGQAQTFLYPDLSLNPGQSQTLLWPNYINPTAGRNELWLQVFPADSTVQEPDIVNNGKIVRFWYAPPTSFPFEEQFEDSTLADLHWYVINPDRNKTWTIASTGGQATGQRSARMNFYGYPPQNQKDWLISPQIPLPSSGPAALFYDYAYRFVNASKRDSVIIKISTDCGASFQTLAAFPGDSLNTVPATLTGNFTPSDASHWRTRAIPLPNTLAGQTILLAFYTSNRAGSYFYLDNVHVRASGVGFQVSADADGFRAWPNPAHHEVHLTTTQEVKVSILSSLGLPLASYHLSEGKCTIPLRQFSSGVYLMHVKGENLEKIIELVVLD